MKHYLNLQNTKDKADSKGFQRVKKPELLQWSENQIVSVLASAIAKGKLDQYLNISGGRYFKPRILYPVKLSVRCKTNNIFRQ